MGDGNTAVSITTPLDKLPLFLVADQLLPLLDPSIDTLAPATDPAVVTLDDVADRLDIRVALTPGGKAELTLADGTVLRAERVASTGSGGLDAVSEEDLADCASCYVTETLPDLERVRANASDSEITVNGLHLSAKGGPARRVRWEAVALH